MDETQSATRGAAFTAISDLAFEAANAKGKEALSGPLATAARYDQDRHAIVIDLTTDAFVGLPVDKLEGLAGATPAQLDNIVVEAGGLGLHWPELDADLHVPSLLDGVFGSRKWMAAQLGAAGGKATSAAKAASSKRNGRKGGRPRKSPAI